MQRFFTRQMKSLVAHKRVLDLLDGAAHGRFTHANTAGDMKLAALLAPVTQTQQHLLFHAQLAGTAKATLPLRDYLHHRLKHCSLDAGQPQKLLLAILAHFDESHSSKLIRLLQEVY